MLLQADLSVRFLYIPDESPDTEIRSLLIHGLELRKDAIDLVVRYKCEDGIVHGRPGVIAQMRLAAHTSAACDVLPHGESSAAEFFQSISSPS